MPFSQNVKTKAVEAAAGHCCVCHRFDAGHIEVHHIIPQANGGSDDFENAIALCFDCHTWAGHYNNRHPKGFRYSPEYLQVARNSWYAKVAAGPIAVEDAAVQARYLISRDHDVSTRLLAGDLSVSPIKDALLAGNEFGKFFSTALGLRPQGLRRFLGNDFTSIEDYLQVHPDAKCHHSDLDGYAYYDCVRECGSAELAQRISEDRLSQLALDRGADSTDLCVVAADNSQCGDGAVTEIYLTRPAWVVFLALTNITNRPLTLEQVLGQRDTSERYRPLGAQADEFVLHMPPCGISPSQTVLVPMSLLFGPIEELGEEQAKINEFLDAGDSIEIMNLTEFPPEGLTNFRLLGPAFWPKQVVARRAGVPITQSVHKLALGSVYTLDRVWQCGSCPHLFMQSHDGTWRYLTELIPNGQRVEVFHSIDLPSDATVIVIAELEDEVSVLTEIAMDGCVVARKIEMHKGDVLRIPLSGARTLSVAGSYFPLRQQLDTKQGDEMRNRLVCQFLSRLNNSLVTEAPEPLHLRIPSDPNVDAAPLIALRN